MLDTGDEALFGVGALSGLVAAERAADDAVELFVRTPEGRVVSERRDLRPFAWVEDAAPGAEALAGDLACGGLATCDGWKEFSSLNKVLKASGQPFFAWPDPVTQYLAFSGETMFKGLDFEDLRRMQIDVETDTAEGFDFPHPSRDPLAAIAMADSEGWEEVILVERGNPASEKAALELLGARVRERDPDVLEGHNIFNFDLPYLQARARRHKLKLAWGRGGQAAVSRPSRLQIAERLIQFDRFSVYGRQIVDTWILAQRYDAATRELDGLGLKSVALRLGVAEPGRRLLEGDRIAAAYRAGDAAFEEYARHDVRETRAVAAALSQSYFIQARIFPMGYQEVILRGNATKIDALLLREYLRRRHSIPSPPPSEPFEGGATDVFETGVIRDVWHCDAASLYPSILLAFGIAPRNDRLGVFLGLLAALRRFRLDAKARLRAEAEPRARARLDALQQTFKILINSFYGYLGFAQGRFADFDAARDVAARGRQILGAMVDWLREAGARVIEIDTDGIYFHPPEGVSGEELEKGMAEILPPGIEVEFDRRYRAMFSYKAKNYALLEQDGQVVIKGGALKSRGMEPYLRDYLEQMIRCLLEGRPDKASGLKDVFLERLRSRRMPIAELAKTETLQDSLASYQRKISAGSRNRAAAFEIALRSGRDYRAGDQIRFYISGGKKNPKAYEDARPLSERKAESPDENIPYYEAKLEDLSAKFSGFFSEEPRLI